MDTDTGDITEFLHLLFDRCDEGYIEARPIKDGQVQQEFFPVSGTSSASEYLTSVAGRLNAFIGVCPRKAKNGSSEYVHSLNAIWCDVDAKDFDEGKSSVLQHLKESAPLPPSFIVDSGNGFHGYWLLDKPYEINGDEESVQELVKRFHSCVGGDHTHDLSRIMRVPGTLNLKNEEDPTLCKFVEKEGTQYTVDELVDAVREANQLTIADLREKVPHQVIQRAKQAPPRFEDDRSGNDYYVAQELSRAGLSEEEIYRAFDLFDERGWDAGEKYQQRGEEYVDHLLDGSIQDQRERLDGLLESLERGSNPSAGQVQEACQIIGNLPPVQQDLKAKELQDALGGRGTVSIKSIRKQIENSSAEGGIPDSAAEAGRRLLTKRSYMNLEGELYVYDGGVYREDAGQIIREDLASILGDKWSRSRRDDAIEWVKDQTYTEIDGIPDNSGLINCKNGVYDIQEGELVDHSPEHRFLWQLDAKYDPDAEYGRLDQFMDEVFYEEDIPVVWEHAGYCLLPNLNLKKFLILLGSGDNGKSVWLNIIESVLGGDNVSHETLRTLTENRFSTRQLFGKLANVCADITADRVEHSEVLKALTGDDVIRAEVKFGPTFDFRNQAKLLFSANEPPSVSDISKAFFRRLHLIRCPNEFPPGDPKRDPNLMDKLTTEEAKSAWLNKAIEGAERLIQQNRFSRSERIYNELWEYRKQVDSVTEFIDSCLTNDDNSYERQKDVYDTYQQWCKSNGRQAVSSRVFRERSQISPNELEPGENDGTKVWENVRLEM